MQKRAVNRVTKPNNFRRPNRRLDEDQLAAHFEGSEEENALYRAAAAVASAEGQNVDETDEAVMEEVGNAFKNDQAQHDVNIRGGEGEDGVEVDHEAHHHHQQHGGHDMQGDALDHEMPMAPMSAEPHHQQTHHVGHQNLDDILGHASMTYAQAAAAAADLQPPPPPQPNVGNATISAPQPLVAATDFQPTPSTSHTTAQSLQPTSSGGSAQQQQQQQQQQAQDPPQPPPKTTEQMAEESGYAGFKVDSAFAKRMSRDPGQRLAEQRRQGQDLNLVRRSNVEALFAQIAGSEAANPCAHCRKGQGPWTVCVVYSGQMMGSCANCWFNASGSRCSFHGELLFYATFLYTSPSRATWILCRMSGHAMLISHLPTEKSQPPLPGAHHPYATLPVAMPVLGQEQGIGVGPGPAAVAAGQQQHMVGGSPAQLHAAQLWQAPAALFSHDNGVKHTVQNALVQVRQADRYTRALIEVEVAAKQLALKIVHAEEVAAGLGVGVEGDEDEQQQQQHEQHGGVDEDEDARHGGSGYESPAPGGNGMPEDGEP